MKSLKTLLKVAKAELETLRRALAQELEKQAHMQERIRAHDQALHAEQQLAARDYESARAYGGYAAAAVLVRRRLVDDLANMSVESDRLRTLIAEAHVEMRKFERLIEMQDERALAAREKREADELDEMATIRAGRARG